MWFSPDQILLKTEECFDRLSMNGEIPKIFNCLPFVLSHSANSG